MCGEVEVAKMEAPRAGEEGVEGMMVVEEMKPVQMAG